MEYFRFVLFCVQDGSFGFKPLKNKGKDEVFRAEKSGALT